MGKFWNLNFVVLLFDFQNIGLDLNFFDLASHCAKFGTWFNILLGFQFHWYLLYIIFIRFPRNVFQEIIEFIIFSFRFSTLKTGFDIEFFLPRLILCEVLYLIQHTSSLPISFILAIYHLYKVPQDRFSKNSWISIVFVSVFDFENRLGHRIFLTSPHIVRSSVLDSTYF